jgi:hypothetical protein
MSEFKRIYLVAFLIGLAAYSLQNAGPRIFFKATAESTAQESTSALHPKHEAYVEKSEDNLSMGTGQNISSEKNEDSQKTDLVEQSKKLHSERALSSRDEWDQAKGKNSELILYFMDRYPPEIAEEIINAFR